MPAATNSQPIRLSGRFVARTIPSETPATLTNVLRTFEKFQRSEPALSGSATWRSRYIRTREPASRASDTVPTAHATRGVLIGFIPDRWCRPEASAATVGAPRPFEAGPRAGERATTRRG